MGRDNTIENTHQAQRFGPFGKTPTIVGGVVSVSVCVCVWGGGVITLITK